MQELAQRVRRLSESATIRMARLSRELKKDGKNIISLSLGEPDFDTPAHIKEAAKRAIDDGYTHYPPVGGFRDLRLAIAGKFKREQGLDYDSSQILVSNGAKQSLINLLMCLVNEGDEVVVPAPFWVSYPEMIKIAGGKMKVLPTGVEEDFKISPGQLDEAITPNTRVFLFCSPSNPTGSVYSKEELKALVEVFEQHPQVFIISDEIYDLINFSGSQYSIARYEALKDRTAIVNGVSKSYAMTGWRIGYMAAPLEISQACEKIQGQFTSGAGSVSQMAALEAITSDPGPALKMRDAFKKRRDLVIDKLRKIKGLRFNVPQGAFYLFPDVSKFFGTHYSGGNISNSTDFCMYLLEEANVSMVPGVAFGDDRCVRISFSASEKELSEAVDRMGTALEKLH